MLFLCYAGSYYIITVEDIIITRISFSFFCAIPHLNIIIIIPPSVHDINYDK